MAPPQRLRVRIGTWAYVTGVECAGLYKWLRNSVEGHEGRGAVYLVVEETLESGLLLLVFVQGPQQPPPKPDPVVAAHLQSAQRAAALAINAEILIWLVWFGVTKSRGGTVPAAIFLAVTMHLKHQLEAAAVLDEPYWSQFKKWPVIIGSASEVIGATAASQLMRAGRHRAAAAALYLGIGFEHALFITEVQNEMAKRDICLPRPPSTAADGRSGGGAASDLPEPTDGERDAGAASDLPEPTDGGRDAGAASDLPEPTDGEPGAGAGSGP
jgi:hypothetical protein